jgi:Ca2+-binding EF-hand superfamily protein
MLRRAARVRLQSVTLCVSPTQVFDMNHDNQITADELMHIFTSLGINIDREAIGYMIKDVDKVHMQTLHGVAAERRLTRACNTERRWRYRLGG